MNSDKVVQLHVDESTAAAGGTDDLTKYMLPVPPKRPRSMGLNCPWCKGKFISTKYQERKGQPALWLVPQHKGPRRGKGFARLSCDGAGRYVRLAK
jgi:hypothetical protein